MASELQREYDDAWEDAAAAAARLGTALGRFQNATDRLGAATKALKEAGQWTK